MGGSDGNYGAIAMRILAISSTFPYPPSKGGTEIRTYNLLARLAQRHAVTIATQRHPSVTDDHLAALRATVQEVMVFPLPPDPAASRSPRQLARKVKRFGQSWLRGTPPNVLHRFSRPMQAWIDQQIAADRFDVVTCEHSVNEIYVRPDWQRRYPKLRSIVDVHSSVYGWAKGHLDLGASPHPTRDWLYLPLLARYERRYANKFSAIVTTTPDDRDYMAQFAPQVPGFVIPNGVDLALFPLRDRDPGGYELVFVGAMDATHNIDAVKFFVNAVLPPLRSTYPAATFRIVGARPSAEVLALGDRPGVVVTGPVDSMAAELHRASVCVVPLRTGLGIKNKTLEAMAAGVPVVGSDRGLEGLTIDQPPLALRANQPAEYIAAIGRLWESTELRAQLSQAARAYVERDFSWDQAAQHYEAVLQSSPQQPTFTSFSL
nr:MULTISPECIES: glycosyltransferase family 4 protein [unclassified Limnothrix]